MMGSETLESFAGLSANILPEEWPFADRESWMEYKILQARAYQLLSEAHELFMTAAQKHERWAR